MVTGYTLNLLVVGHFNLRSFSCLPISLLFHDTYEQIAPPLWAQTSMVLAVIASATAWIHITPLYFISGGEHAEKVFVQNMIAIN